MAKKKAEGSSVGIEMNVASELSNGDVDLSHAKLDHIAVDFPNEGLNNLARKINQVIDHLNG